MPKQKMLPATAVQVYKDRAQWAEERWNKAWRLLGQHYDKPQSACCYNVVAEIMEALRE